MTHKDIFHDAFPQDKQIGGSHYKKFRIQPYEFISKNDLSFFQGNVVKYVCRYKNKNGIQDLEKIIQLGIEESIHLEYKRELNNNEKIAKTISSFANSDGGNIIYGILEEGHKPIDLSEAILQLSFIALKMMNERKQKISIYDLKNFITEARKEHPAILGYSQMSISEFIEQIELRSSLMICLGLGIDEGVQSIIYEFKHLTFLEYFAANAIVKGYCAGSEREKGLEGSLQEYLEDDFWREVIIIVASLSETRTETFLKYLLKYYRKLGGIRAFSFITILSQCLVEKIQITPSLAREIIFEVVSLSTKVPDNHFKFMLQGKFKELLIDITYQIYKSKNYTMANKVLGIICLDYLNWDENYDISKDLLENLKKLILDDDIFYRILGWCGLHEISLEAYFFKEFSILDELVPNFINFEEMSIKLLDSDSHFEIYAVLDFFSLIGRLRRWESNINSKYLRRLFNLLENSKGVFWIRVLQAIEVFPIILKNLKFFLMCSLIS